MARAISDTCCRRHLQGGRCLPPLTACAHAHAACTRLRAGCRFESAEMYWMLHDCGVPAKHLVYNKASARPARPALGLPWGCPRPAISACLRRWRAWLPHREAARVPRPDRAWPHPTSCGRAGCACGASSGKALVPQRLAAPGASLRRCACLLPWCAAHRGGALRTAPVQVGHGEFVTEWAALPRISGGAAADESDLPPHAADLVKILGGRARVAYSRAE